MAVLLLLLIALCMFGFYNSFLFVDAISKFEKINPSESHPYYYSTPFNLIESSVQVVCHGDDGCSLLYSPAGCGCKSSCVKQLNHGNKVPKGLSELKASTSTVFDGFSGICSSDQLNIFAEGEQFFEWPHASFSGTTFSTVFRSKNSFVNRICGIRALSLDADIEYTNGDSEPTKESIESFQTKYITFGGDETTARRITISSTNDIVVNCYQIITIDERVEIHRYFILPPVTTESLYGSLIQYQAISSIDNEVPESTCTGGLSQKCPDKTTIDKIVSRQVEYIEFLKLQGFRIDATHSAVSVSGIVLDENTQDHMYLPKKYFSSSFIFPKTSSGVFIISDECTKCAIQFVDGSIKNLDLHGNAENGIYFTSWFGEAAFTPGTSMYCEAPVMVLAHTGEQITNFIGDCNADMWQTFRELQYDSLTLSRLNPSSLSIPSLELSRGFVILPSIILTMLLAQL